MNSVNTEGMALIGPGSEWFWTALGGVALTVTFIAIYRQLRLQRSAEAIEHLASLSGSGTPRGWRGACSRPSLPSGTSATRGVCRWPPMRSGDFWQRVGYMVRERDVDRRLVHQYLFSDIRAWWHWLAPTVRFWRESEGLPLLLYGHFEWLAGLMVEMDRKAGRTMTFDEGSVARSLAASIEIRLHLVLHRRGAAVRRLPPGVHGDAPARDGPVPGRPMIEGRERTPGGQALGISPHAPVGWSG